MTTAIVTVTSAGGVVAPLGVQVSVIEQAAVASHFVEAATTEAPRFRWQTSGDAVRFAGLSLADLDGSRVLAATSAWVRAQPS